MEKHTLNENLYLETLKIENAEELFNCVNSSRDTLEKWLPWLENYNSINDSKNFIIHSDKLYKEKKSIQLGIWFNNKLVGVIGINMINYDNNSASIGYWLNKEYEKNGIMTQACKYVIKYCFENLNLNRIEIRAACNNIKSNKLINRLGFKFEGITRECEKVLGSYLDHNVYSCLKKEFNIL